MTLPFSFWPSTKQCSRKLKSATFTFHREMRPTLSERRVLLAPNDPRYWIVERNWQERDKTRLQIEALPLINGPKAFIRGWCAKRLKHALKEALKEKGYDEYGRPLKIDAGVAPSTLRPLRGCAELRASPEVLQMRFTDVVEEQRSVVDDICRLCKLKEQSPSSAVPSPGTRGSWRSSKQEGSSTVPQGQG